MATFLSNHYPEVYLYYSYVVDVVNIFIPYDNHFLFDSLNLIHFPLHWFEIMPSISFSWNPYIFKNPTWH